MYCTLDDIKAQLPEETILQLTDDDSMGVIDAARVGEIIANVGQVIDGYAAVRYQLPFAQAPAILKPIAIDLAIYELYARRVETMPEVRAAKQKNAIKLLTDISTGKIRLGAAEAAAVVQPGQSPQVTGNPRRFSRSSMRGL